MHEFRRADRLGVQSAGFLELQRDFLRGGIADAATDDVEVMRRRQGTDRLAPVEGEGGTEHIGEGWHGLKQRRVAAPFGDHLQGCCERREIGLGRRDAPLRARVQRQHHLADSRQRRGCIVDDGDRQRAVVAGHLGERQKVGTAPGLRDRQEERLAHVELRPVDGTHRRADRGHDHPEAKLDQIFGVGRRAVGAAPRAGDDEARRGLPQACAERPAGVGVPLDQPPHRVRRLGGFARHQRRSRILRRHLQDRHGAGPIESSATKSYASPR